MKEIKKILLLFLILFSGGFHIYSQETVHVITRKTEKEFAVQPKSRLTINAERGIIIIKSWNENNVKVTLKLVAKNKELETAREEVQYMQYTLTEGRNEIILKNVLLLPSKKEYSELSSIIRAEYDIYIPDNMPVTIRNKFGSVTLRNLNATLNIDLEYSDLTLHDCNAELDLFINTGDLVCSRSELNATIETRYSQINFNQVKGDIKLIMMYGNIYISLSNDLTMDLTANRTDVLLVNRECSEYKIKINGEYTPLRIQPDCYFKKAGLLKNSYENDVTDIPWILDYSPPGAKSKLTIEARFGTINLN